MEVIRTAPGKIGFELFEQVPSIIYPAGSIRLRQLDTVNVEFLKVVIVVLNRGIPSGRLAVYNNPHLRYKEQPVVCIGNYECENNPETAELLFRSAFEEIGSMNVKTIIGPMNGSTWDNYRFSDHNNEPNFLLEPYHHLYYNEQFLKNGFRPLSHYSSRIDREVHCNDPEVMRRWNELQQLGVIIRPIDLENYDEELKRLFPFIKNAFRTNFLYSDISWESFHTKYSEAKVIIDPEYVQIAEDSNGNSIGFIFACANRYCTDEKQLIVKTIARSADKQWTGLGHVIADKVLSRAKKNGYKAIIHAFMIQEGTSTGISRNFSGENYKSYTLYLRTL